jgi:integrase
LPEWSVSIKTTPHTLRHTAATWLMQEGADEWVSAGYLGMSVEVLRSTYGHHHPDFMKGAMDAITSKKKRSQKEAQSVPPLCTPAEAGKNRMGSIRWSYD